VAPVAPLRTSHPVELLDASMQRTLVPARDADSQEVDTVQGERCVTALRIAKIGVAAVDQDVTGVEVGRISLAVVPLFPARFRPPTS
jgi:hypothetical protein